MATCSSVFVWKFPWTEEPARPQSMGSQRVRHDWVTEYTCTDIKTLRPRKYIFVIVHFNESLHVKHYALLFHSFSELIFKIALKVLALQALQLPPFPKWGPWSSEELSNLPQMPQLVTGDLRLEPKSGVFVFNHCLILPEAACGIGGRQAEGHCHQVHSTANCSQGHMGLLSLTHKPSWAWTLLGERKHMSLNFRENWPSGFIKELKIADKKRWLANSLWDKWKAKFKRGRTIVQGNTARQWQHQTWNLNLWLPVRVGSPLSSPILWLLKHTSLSSPHSLDFRATAPAVVPAQS